MRSTNSPSATPKAGAPTGIRCRPASGSASPQLREWIRRRAVRKRWNSPSRPGRLRKRNDWRGNGSPKWNRGQSLPSEGGRSMRSRRGVTWSWISADEQVVRALSGGRVCQVLRNGRAVATPTLHMCSQFWQLHPFYPVRAIVSRTTRIAGRSACAPS